MVDLSHRFIFDKKPKQVLIDFESGDILLDGEKILKISPAENLKISVTEKYLHLEDRGYG